MSNIKDEKRYLDDKKDKKEDKKYPHDKKIDPISGRYSDYVNQDAIPGVNTPGVNGVGMERSEGIRLANSRSGVDRIALNCAGVNEVGINPTGIALPAFNPPVPNRAWTAMRAGLDIDQLSEEEKRELYYGKDPII